MKFILAVVVVIVLEVLAGLAIMYSGRVDVAATTPDCGLKAWVLSETMDHSVKYHARSVQSPASLSDSAMLQAGFRSFDRMCSGCHGAPGVARRGAGGGMNPEPPSLAAVVDEWTPSELFWITKHGIKMTGMPAYGKNHSDDDLWAIVAFVRTLPNIEPEDYLALRQSFARPDSTMNAPADSARRRNR